MNVRTVALGLGAAITTFLLVGAATIQWLGPGEAPAIGIIGVFVGFVAGVLAGGIVTIYAERLAGLLWTVLVGYATFGILFIAIAAMRYVNLPGADDLFTFPIHLGVSLGAAIVLALLVSQRSVGQRPSLD